MTLAVSVVVSNLNGRKYLPKLLETLRGQRGVTVQIVVVDRYSQDGSRDYLAAQQDVTVLDEPPETGLVTGYDAGVSACQHDRLFFCNEDMWFDPDCLRLLADKIDPTAGLVAADPWQWTYDGLTHIHGSTRFRLARWDWVSAYPLRKYDFLAPAEAGPDTPFGCAGAVMFDRAAYHLAGGWDRGFFLDHEDIDLFLRVWQLGWRCAAVPEAKVYHAVGASNAQHIVATNTPVKRRRYISGVASISVIGVKYFAGSAVWLPFVIPIVAVAKDLFRLRLRRAWLTAIATAEFACRLPAALAVRRRWAARRRQRPGQGFFLDPRFQASHPTGPNTSGVCSY